MAFLYLGYTVSFNNSDWEALYQNLRKSLLWWDMVVKMLTRTGLAVRSRKRAIIYKAAV